MGEVAGAGYGAVWRAEDGAFRRGPWSGRRIQDVLPEWTWIIGFWVGAAVGSFLNVVIYRLPRGLSIYEPKNSFCTVCRKQLTAGELVPLLSWLFQKGRCRCGESRVPPRYFIVELVNGVLWAAIWYQQFTQLPEGVGSVAEVSGERLVLGVGYLLFASGLVAAIFTDLAHYIIPDQVNAWLLVVGLGMNVGFVAVGSELAWIWGMPSAVAGALVGWGVLWGIAFLGRVLFGRDAMGHGDIKMARGIGAVLLPLGAGISFGLAVFLGAVVGVMQVLARGRPAEAGGGGEGEEAYEPESLGSLLKCGVGYLLCIDVVGLVFPKLYESWFGENPYSVEEIDDEPEVEHTMIPFGPYLAAGALGVVLFGPVLSGWVDAYWSSMSGL